MGNRVFYICPDNARPAGGIKVIYQHVDILRANGIDAFVAHINSGFRCHWFKNNVPVQGINSINFSSTDILVVPAVWAVKFRGFAPETKKVIINQGAYLTFRGYPIENYPFETPYHDPNLLGVMVVSEDNQRYLEYVFPDLEVKRIRNYIDTDIFRFSAEKRRQITFMTRKRHEDIEQVINILRYRGVLQSFTLAPITDKSEMEVVATLMESLLFLNFCFEEGWSLPAAEAMSCGCIVVGNHGYGAREILRPEFSYPVEQGNVIDFARQAEEVIRMYDKNPELITEKTRMAAEFIRSNYSRSVAEKELLDFWSDKLGA